MQFTIDVRIVALFRKSYHALDTVFFCCLFIHTPNAIDILDLILVLGQIHKWYNQISLFISVHIQNTVTIQNTQAERNAGIDNVRFNICAQRHNEV